MAQQQNTPTATGQPAGQQGQDRTRLYIIIGIIVAVIVALILLGIYFSSSGVPALTQTASQNSTSIPMGSAQAQTLLGSSLINYSVSDLFNPASPLNMSDLISVVPQLYDNATSGWITVAQGSNATSNASIEYIAITTSNVQTISSLLGSASVSGLPMTEEKTNTGSVNGFAYTYWLYSNSTANMQVLSGWKNNDAAIAIILSNPPFTVNETALVSAVANDTP